MSEFGTRNIGPRRSNHEVGVAIDLHVPQRPASLAHIRALRSVVEMTRNARLSVPFLASAARWHVVDLSVELEPHLIRSEN